MKAFLSSQGARRAVVWALLAVAALATFLYSQGRGITGGPSEATAKVAIEASLKAQVPAKVAKSLYPCRATHVNRVTVLDVGGSVEVAGRKAWAVRARAWGEMESFGLGGRSVSEFSGEGVWLVSRGPLGEWAASASEQ